MEILVYLAVTVGLATLPLWFLAWWTALPVATALGGFVGGRWLRWWWAPAVGFTAGALAWGIQLEMLSPGPMSRLADVLGAAQGLTGTVFLILGPVLFGLVAGVTATAWAGALRLLWELRRSAGETPQEVPPGPGAAS